MLTFHRSVLGKGKKKPRGTFPSTSRLHCYAYLTSDTLPTGRYENVTALFNVLRPGRPRERASFFETCGQMISEEFLTFVLEPSGSRFRCLRETCWLPRRVTCQFFGLSPGDDVIAGSGPK